MLSTVFRAGRAAAPRASFTVARAMSSATTPLKREIISEKAIHNTSYNNDGSSAATVHSIPVRPNPDIEVPVETDANKVVPLTQATYKGMTPMMQKMSIMGKVVIVTG
jgi:hypothetical protein